jgi:pimeloyl-ACP methyl ester carboxylesterase
MDLTTFNAHRRTVITPYGEIAYVDIGTGPAALFVHGVFLNGSLWRNVIGELEGERRCIAIDLPAHGATRAAPGLDFSLANLAKVLDRFCAALDLGPVDLVGNDTGGALCQLFAATYPGRLRSLTLTDCDTQDNLPPERFKPVVELARQGALVPLIAQLQSNRAFARSEQALGAGYEHPERVSDETIEGYLAPFGSPEMQKEVERFTAALEPSDLQAAEPRLRALTVPTLIVWGTADPFFDLSWAYWLRDTIPGTREVVELPGAKLSFPDERPQELAAALRRHWVASLAVAPA